MGKVTVIVPTIGRNSLSDCLNSLFRQSRRPDEVIVVDNSKDKKARHLVPDNVRYVHEKKRGAGYARNRGIKAATNDTLCFIDDDCVASINWLKELSGSFMENKDAIIMGDNENGNEVNLLNCVEYYDEQLLFKSDLYSFGKKTVSFWLDSKNFIVSKKLLEKNGIYFNDFHLIHDLDFALQAHSNKITIFYCSKAKVAHFGERNLINHFGRESIIGRENAKMSQKWRIPNKNLAKALFSRKFLWKKRWESQILKHNLTQKVLRKGDLFFRIGFYVLLATNRVVNFLSYYLLRY